MLKLNWENMQQKIEISDEIIKNITLSLEKALESEEFEDGIFIPGKYLNGAMLSVTEEADMNFSHLSYHVRQSPHTHRLPQ